MLKLMIQGKYRPLMCGTTSIDNNPGLASPAICCSAGGKACLIPESLSKSHSTHNTMHDRTVFGSTEQRSMVPARSLHAISTPTQSLSARPRWTVGVLYLLYKLCSSLVVPSAAATVSRVHRSLLSSDGIRPSVQGFVQYLCTAHPASPTVTALSHSVLGPLFIDSFLLARSSSHFPMTSSVDF